MNQHIIIYRYSNADIRTRKSPVPDGVRGMMSGEAYCECSGLHFIKHGNVGVEQLDDFVEVWVAALNNKSHILFTRLVVGSYALYLCSTDYVVFLLFGPVEPPQEQPCPLSLLTFVGAAHIKKNVRVLTEELLDDTYNRLGYLLVARRRHMIHIRQGKPICGIERIGVIIECDGIFNAIVGKEHERTIFIIRDEVRRAVVDVVGIESVHNLYPFKVVISRLGSLFLAALTFSILCLGLSLPTRLNLAATLQQSKEILARPFGLYCLICCHNPNMFDFWGQRYEKAREMQKKSQFLFISERKYLRAELKDTEIN